MLDRIIQFSVRNKFIVAAMTIVMIAWGVYSFLHLPIDAVPDITNNQVQILTVSPANSAEDIERFVTFPVELSLSTIPGKEEIRSFSRFGLSVVTVVFREDIDIYWARQQVSERLTQVAGQLPPGMGTPELAPLTTGLGEIFQYVIYPKPGYEKMYSPTEMRSIQDWIVRRQLLGVEGVADVSSFGGLLKQYEVAVDPERLHNLHVSMEEILTALKKNNQNSGGAYIEEGDRAFYLRSEGIIRDKGQIENILVKTNENGIPILIREVADVRFGSAIRYGALTRNGQGETVGGIVLMLKGANSNVVIESVKERIGQIQKNLPEGIVIEPFLDRTKLVDKAIGTVAKNLIEGALIVIFVLVLLLGNLRAGLLVASVIPLAMLFAIAMMRVFGVSGNLMSLGAIDFGLIVDGAVIIVEATMHHLIVERKTNRTQKDMDDEVVHSAGRIMNSAAFGQIIILIVYLPILSFVGVEGKMFKPMAQTVSFAIIGAFIFSLTYVPMMSSVVLNKNPKNKKNISDRIMEVIRKVYEPALHFVLKKSKTIVSGAVILLVGSVFIFTQLGAEFIPTLEEGDFAVETRVMTGTSLQKVIETSNITSKILLDSFPEVKQVVCKIGSSEIPTDPMPIEAYDMILVLKDKSEWTSAGNREELAQKMQSVLERNTIGVSYGFQQPIQMRFNELMTGARQDVVVKIYGEDLNKLTRYAKQVAALTSEIEGAKDLYVEQVGGLTQIVVEPYYDIISQYNIAPEEINLAVRAGFAGEITGLVFENEKRFDLVLRLQNNSRNNIEDIKNLYITAPDGHQIPIHQLANVSYRESPNQIQRDEAKRRIIVGFNVRGRDVESTVNELMQKVDKQIKFEPGYFPTYGGMFKNLQDARNRLLIVVPIALLLILILLYISFNSVKQSILIFAAIPLSAIGGIIALYLRDMPFSISAGVGFIALFGVAVLNGIVLIGEFNRLKKESDMDVIEIIKTGTAVRLRPVVMTAMVASLGFLPMAISHGAGAEVQKPLATVVVGGLITATILTLLVLPVLYLLAETKRKRKNTTIVSVLTVFVFLCPAGVYAQSLTVDQAVETALKNNALIKSAQLDVNMQQAYARSATEIPKTNISYMRGQYNSANKNDNNITVSQSIPFPTVFSAQKMVNTANIKSSEAQLEMTENDLRREVRSTYYQLWYLSANQEFLRRQDSVYAFLFKAAGMRYDKGDISLLEKVSVETQMQDIKNQMRQNELMIQSSLYHLQLLMGTKEQVMFDGKSFTTRSFSALQDTVKLKSNPMLAYMEQQVNLSLANQKFERASTLPDLSVGYFNQTLIGIQSVNGQDVYFGSDKRFQGFILGLSVPIWFMPHIAKSKAAGIEAMKNKTQLESVERTLFTQYDQLIQDYLRAQENLNYYTVSALPNADLIRDQSAKSYTLGEMSYSEFLLAVKSVNDIYSGYYTAVNEYNQIVIQLEHLLTI